MIRVEPSPMTAIEEMTDPDELARALVHREQFDRNWVWLKDHAVELYTRYRGKYVVVADQQAFFGNTANEARAQMAEAQIEDRGSFIIQVPKRGSGMRRVPPVVMVTEITDAAELAAAKRRKERADQNAAWMQAHADELFALYRGKCVCIAGQEAFAADTSREAVALAASAHPEDDGRLIYRVPMQKAVRVYAH
jgi:hypothetical protein